MEAEEPQDTSNCHKHSKQPKKSRRKVTHKIITTVRYVIPRPITAWRKFAEKRKRKRTSKKIDKNLKKDCNFYYGILVLGRKESGKTTICKQMKMLYGKEYSDAEKHIFMKTIEKNIKDGISYVSEKVFNMDDSDQKDMLLFIKNYDFKTNNRRTFFLYVEILWNNPYFQASLRDIHQKQLIETMKHFVNKIEALKRIDYVPTNEDILHCYEPSKGVVEIEYKIDSCYYKISEISNLMFEKRLWKQIIDGTFVIMFIIPINIFLSEQNKNSFKDTLEEFYNFGNNFCHIYKLCGIILLNKVDLFSKIILKTILNLEEYFPGLCFDKDVCEDRVVTETKNFILNEFGKIIQSSRMWFGSYIHFICAIDSGDVNDVFKQCQTEIQKSYFSTCRLI